MSLFFLKIMIFFHKSKFVFYPLFRTSELHSTDEIAPIKPADICGFSTVFPEM